MRTNHCCHHTNIYRDVTDQDDNNGGVDGAIRRDDAPERTPRTAEAVVRSMKTAALESEEEYGPDDSATSTSTT